METAESTSGPMVRTAVADVEAVDALAPVRALLKALLVALPALLGILALCAASRP
jgi:hypothetical protein